MGQPVQKGKAEATFTCPSPVADMIENSAVAAVVTDPRLADNPIVACNEAFVRLTGYARDEVLGRNCRFLAGPDQGPLLVEEMKAAVQERRPLLAQIVNFKKDGTRFLNALMIAPVFDRDDELEYFLGSQQEVGTSASPAPSDGRTRLDRLPRRQRQVLSRMLEGKRNKAIACELGISERTVKLHRAALLDSLGVRSSAEAIRLAAEAVWTASADQVEQR